MLLVAVVPLVVCIVGLLLYVLASNPKLTELGRLSFAVGLLVFLMHVASGVVRVSL